MKNKNKRVHMWAVLQKPESSRKWDLCPLHNPPLYFNKFMATQDLNEKHGGESLYRKVGRVVITILN